LLPTDAFRVQIFALHTFNKFTIKGAEFKLVMKPKPDWLPCVLRIITLKLAISASTNAK